VLALSGRGERAGIDHGLEVRQLPQLHGLRVLMKPY
jgi:hypothetical protein